MSTSFFFFFFLSHRRVLGTARCCPGPPSCQGPVFCKTCCSVTLRNSFYLKICIPFGRKEMGGGSEISHSCLWTFPESACHFCLYLIGQHLVLFPREKRRTEGIAKGSQEKRLTSSFCHTWQNL